MFRKDIEARNVMAMDASSGADMCAHMCLVKESEQPAVVEKSNSGLNEE